MTNGPQRSRTTAAVIRMSEAFACHHAGPAGSFRERKLQLSVLVFRRIDDHLLVPGQVLVEPASLHVLELYHDDARGSPFAQCIETEFSHDRVELVLVDVIG